MQIINAENYSEFLLEGVNLLIPQLSNSASLLTKKQLTDILDSKSSHLFIATSNNHIYGMLTIVIIKIPTGIRAWIEDVVVSEDARGKGVGLLLLNTAIDFSKSNNCKTIDLTSRPGRKSANNLYRKAGFIKRETNVYRFQP